METLPNHEELGEYEGFFLQGYYHGSSEKGPYWLYALQAYSEEDKLQFTVKPKIFEMDRAPHLKTEEVEGFLREEAIDRTHRIIDQGEADDGAVYSFEVTP